MSRKKQRKQTKAAPGYDKHHLLYYRRNCDIGYKQLLRRAFVYELPVEIHKKIHILAAGIPPLNEREAQDLWVEFNNAARRDMSLYEALDWLVANSPNDDFRNAIMTEYAVIRYCL